MVRLFSNVSNWTQYGEGSVLQTGLPHMDLLGPGQWSQNTTVSLLGQFGRTAGVYVGGGVG